MTSVNYDHFNDFGEFSLRIKDADFGVFRSANFPSAESRFGEIS